MSEVNPRRRTRIRPAASEAEVRPQGVMQALVEPYDGPPPPAPVTDPVTGAQRPGQRSLSERIRLMQEYASEDEAAEFIMNTIAQFTMAGMSLDLIAERMGISYESVRGWKRKLVEREKQKIKQIDAHTYLGHMIATYEETRQAAFREMAAAKPSEAARRLGAMDRIMRANTEIAKLLQLGGFFDAAPLRPPLPIDDGVQGEANMLKDLAQRFLTGVYSPENKKSLNPGDVIVEG